MKKRKISEQNLRKPSGRFASESDILGKKVQAATAVISEARLILVLRHIPTDALEGLVPALLEGGIRVIEVALNSSDALAQLKFLRRYDVCLGAGTVLDFESATASIDAGVDFLFSPIRSSFFLPLCQERRVLGIPGGLTPTEIYDLHRGGAHFIKVFPSSIGGARYIRELLAPLRGLKLIPAGGVSRQTVHEFLHAGAAAVAVGREIADPRLAAARDFAEIASRASQFTEKIRSFSQVAR